MLVEVGSNIVEPLVLGSGTIFHHVSRNIFGMLFPLVIILMSSYNCYWINFCLTEDYKYFCNERLIRVITFGVHIFFKNQVSFRVHLGVDLYPCKVDSFISLVNV